MLVTGERPNIDERLAVLLAAGGGRLAAELAIALNVSRDELDRCLERLEARGRVVVVDHASPDSHLDRADLRVVMAVAADGPGAEAQARAHAAAERVWNGWLATFLSAHRCG